MHEFTPIKPFRFFCNKILPLVYDDALSYYEVLCKVTNILNGVIDNVNQHSDAINELGEDVTELDARFDTIPEQIDDRIEEAFRTASGITFEVKLGTTTKTEITNAINAGKIVWFKYQNQIYYYEGQEEVYGASSERYFVHVGISSSWENIQMKYCTIDDATSATPNIKSFVVNNVYTCVYGTTGFNDIKNAFSRGKIVQCNYLNNFYLCVSNSSTQYVFGGVTNDGKFVYLTITSGNQWSSRTVSVEGAKIYIQNDPPSDTTGLWIDPDDDSEDTVDANSIAFSEEASYDAGSIGYGLKQEIERAVDAEEHLEDIKADKAVVSLMDRRIDYIYKNAVDKEFEIVNVPTSGSDDRDKTVECYSRNVFSGVVGAAVNMFGGKSVILNQLAENGDFHTSTGISSNNATFVVANNKVTATITNAGTTSAIRFGIGNVVSGHKYLARAMFKNNSRDVISRIAFLNASGLAALGNNVEVQTSQGINVLVAGIISIDNSASCQVWLYGSVSSATQINDIFEVSSFNAIDITQMFGSDIANTITTPEQVYALGVPREYIQYNAGQLRSAAVSRVVSNSKNLYVPYNFSKTQNGVYFETRLDGSIKVNGTATATTVSATTSNPVEFAELEPGTYAISGKIGNINIQVVTENNAVLINTSTATTFTITDRERVYVRVLINSGDTANNVVIKPQLEKASSPTSYSPPGSIYILSIPEEVLALEGYGESEVGSVVNVNTVDLINMVYHEKGHYVNDTWTANVRDIDISGYFSDTDRGMLAESGGTITFEQSTPSGGVTLELPIMNELDYLVNVDYAAGGM